MNEQFRIGMLIGRFYPFEAGAEIQCRRLSRELIKKNHSVFVLTQKLPNARSSNILEHLPIYRVGLPHKGKWGSLSYLIQLFFWFFRHSAEYDILHVHMASSPAILAAVTGKLFRKPVVLKFAGSRRTGDIATSSATWYGRLKLKFLRAFIGTFVCPSEEIKQELLKAGFPENRIAVIPNGVETGTFTPATAEDKKALRKTLHLPADAPVVTYAGRLEPGKGVEILLDAWKSFENAPGVKPLLLIVGDGSLETALQEKAKALSTVKFCGWQENTAQFLRASDVFVLPSLGEGLPNSLIEAMSCGLCCIATHIGGVTELITSGANGITVAPGNAGELSAAINSACADHGRALEMGRKARLFAEGKLSLEKIAGEYIRLYSETTHK